MDQVRSNQFYISSLQNTTQNTPRYFHWTVDTDLCVETFIFIGMKPLAHMIGLAISSEPPALWRVSRYTGPAHNIFITNHRHGTNTNK